ncbi:gamma-glutamyl-gamma-aminobutyrate hydrolase family protein [Rhodovulum sp. DZ06]|uniref:gamma-glutamyl-gamma-aminobutyrate hydrolase family protein n=1 Tax=Rhodovulum sp. DZ06 TaxID=3425126 RepID=UPI003D329DF4
MHRPVIAVIGNASLINDQYPVQAVGETNMRAVAEAADCLPVMFAALPGIADAAELVSAFDGFVFTGGRPNVHPSFYGHEETEAHGPFNLDRDAVALEVIRGAVDAGKPVLGICRGFQEMAVAYGSTLHPEIRELPGRMNHRMPPDGTLEEKFAIRHKVILSEGGAFAKLMGATEIMTNTLHGQGVIDAGDRVRIEGRAEDGTAEALVIAGAKGFAMGVQWHCEWNADRDPVSVKIYGAFGEAARG